MGHFALNASQQHYLPLVLVLAVTAAVAAVVVAAIRTPRQLGGGKTPPVAQPANDTYDLGDVFEPVDDELDDPENKGDEPDTGPLDGMATVDSLQPGDLVTANRHGFPFPVEVESNDGTWITTTEGDRYLIAAVNREIAAGRVTVKLTAPAEPDTREIPIDDESEAAES
jgi:hypothetical protein